LALEGLRGIKLVADREIQYLVTRANSQYYKPLSPGWKQY
jgi:hypothetical protein